MTDGHLFQIGSLPSRTLYCLYSTATKTFPFTKLGSTAFFFLSSSFFLYVDQVEGEERVVYILSIVALAIASIGDCVTRPIGH